MVKWLYGLLVYKAHTINLNFQNKKRIKGAKNARTLYAHQVEKIWQLCLVGKENHKMFEIIVLGAMLFINVTRLCNTSLWLDIYLNIYLYTKIFYLKSQESTANNSKVTIELKWLI